MIPWHLAPVPVAAGLVLLAGWKWRKTSLPAALGLAAGVVAGFLGVLGGIELKPVSAQGWLPHIALLAAAAGFVRGPIWAALLARVGVGAATAWLLWSHVAQPPWSNAGGAVLAHAAIAVPIAVLWSLYAAAPRRGIALPAGMLMAAGGLSMVLLAAGSASNAEFAATVSMACGAVAALAWFRDDIAFGPAGSGVAVTVLVALTAMGYLFLDAFPWWAAAIALVAPAALLLPTRNPWAPLIATAVIVGATALLWGPLNTRDETDTTEFEESGEDGYDPYAHGYD